MVFPSLDGKVPYLREAVFFFAVEADFFAAGFFFTTFFVVFLAAFFAGFFVAIVFSLVETFLVFLLFLAGLSGFLPEVFFRTGFFP